MADQNKLADWILAHTKELHLKAQLLSWTKEWLPGFTDFSVSIEIDGQTFIGRGIAENEVLAFTKACAEALERAVCFENGLRTSGVALHVESTQAKVNAKLELFERDRFLCHYLTQSGMESIDPQQTGSLNIHKMFQKFVNAGLCFRLYKMRSIKDAEFALCLITDSHTPNRFGAFIGLGASPNIETSCVKASIEAAINAVNWLEGGDAKILSLDEFLSLSAYSPRDHFAVHLHANQESRTWNFCNYPPKQMMELFRLADVDVEQVFPKANILTVAPVYVFRAVSPNLQSVFYGPTQAHLLNNERLSLFVGSGKNNWFYDYPHPLG